MSVELVFTTNTMTYTHRHACMCARIHTHVHIPVACHNLPEIISFGKGIFLLGEMNSFGSEGEVTGEGSLDPESAIG